jgi:hypothetical protein
LGKGSITTADISFVTEVNRVAKPCPRADLCLKKKGGGCGPKSHGSEKAKKLRALQVLV